MKSLYLLILVGFLSSCLKENRPFSSSLNKETRAIHKPSSDELEETSLELQLLAKKKVFWDYRTFSPQQLMNAITLGDGVFAVGIRTSDSENETVDFSKRTTFLQRAEQLIQGIQDTLSLEGGSVNQEDFVVEVDHFLPIVTFKSKNPAVLSYILRQHFVRYVEPLSDPISLHEEKSESGCTPSDYAVNSSDYYSITPNSKISWHWGYHNLSEAWNYGQGLGVTVGLIDAGISASQALLLQQFNSGNSNVGRTHQTAYTYGSSQYTSCAHGTSMAGIIAAPWAGYGNAIGGAHKCNLYSVRAADDVFLNLSAERVAVKNAFVLLGNSSNVKIISMSMGTPLYSSVLYDAVSYAYTMGKLIFCAAGTSTDLTAGLGVIYPAAFSECQAVTGVKENDASCTVCHDGEEVDFTIVMERSINDNRHGVSLNTYNANAQYVGGSSVATASAASIAALVWSYKPWVSRAQILYALKMSAQFPVVRHPLHGYGRMNAGLAMHFI